MRKSRFIDRGAGRPTRQQDISAAILFSDILIVPWALGDSLTFKEGGDPVLPPLRTTAGLDALDPSRVPAAAPALRPRWRSRLARSFLADAGRASR